MEKGTFSTKRWNQELLTVSNCMDKKEKKKKIQIINDNEDRAA